MADPDTTAALMQSDLPIGKSGQPFQPPAVKPYQVSPEQLLELLGPLGDAGTIVGEALRTGHLEAADIPQAIAGVMLGTMPGGPEEGAAARVGAKVAGKAARALKRQKGTGELLEGAAPSQGTKTPPEVGQLAGSKNPLDETPLTYKGKWPKDWTPEEFKEVGDLVGIPDLGPATPAAAFKYSDGSTFQIPGGLEGKFTYYDLLSMKAQGIDPSRMPKELHAQIHQKLLRTMTPPQLTNEHVWNGLVFGMTSPNQPLFPNQLAMSRLRYRDPAMIDQLAGMIPWKAGEKVPEKVRNDYNRNIATAFGLQGSGAWSLATKAPGLGVRGTADYTRAAELAQMFKQDPTFFAKSANETWDQFAGRIGSQVTGLGVKTGALGIVWQDPATAAISAIDRHMAQEFRRQGGLFKDQLEEMAWQNQVTAAWNKKFPQKPAANFTEMQRMPGADGFLGEKLLDYVELHSTPKFRVASGEVNPNIPPHLAGAKWAVEPREVLVMGQNYQRALAYNQQLAQQEGLNLFGSQWLLWDRIRRRLEPHENMFPGLERMPAPSQEQLREVDVEHQLSGHKTYTKTEQEGGVQSLQPTKPRPDPARFGYFALPLAGAAGAAALQPEGDVQGQ